MGDPAKLLMAVEIIDVILRDRLVDLVRVSGGELLGGLKELEVNNETLISLSYSSSFLRTPIRSCLQHVAWARTAR